MFLGILLQYIFYMTLAYLSPLVPHGGIYFPEIQVSEQAYDSYISSQSGCTEGP